MVLTKDILYPIFLECCEFAEDNFWKNVFEDLAYGITPYGTYISKGYLCCGYKDKNFSYKIERQDPEEMYCKIYDLLTNRLGFLSNKEKTKKRSEFHQAEQRIKNSRDSWSKIRKKTIRDLLIERYVAEKKSEYLLTKKQCKFLLSIIFIAMIFKVITSRDINYYDGKIHDIEGVGIEDGHVVVKRDIYDLDMTFSPEIIIDKKVMSDNWEKYLDVLRKVKY